MQGGVAGEGGLQVAVLLSEVGERVLRHVELTDVVGVLQGGGIQSVLQHGKGQTVEPQAVDGLGIAQIDACRAGQRDVVGVGGTHLAKLGDVCFGGLVVGGGTLHDVGAIVGGESLTAQVAADGHGQQVDGELLLGERAQALR